MTQNELYELLKTDALVSWPRIWGSVYAHRRACLLAVQATVDEMLADPGMTRGKLRRELAQVVQEVVERGP